MATDVIQVCDYVGLNHMIIAEVEICDCFCKDFQNSA